MWLTPRPLKPMTAMRMSSLEPTTSPYDLAVRPERPSAAAVAAERLSRLRRERVFFSIVELSSCCVWSGWGTSTSPSALPCEVADEDVGVPSNGQSLVLLTGLGC